MGLFICPPSEHKADKANVKAFISPGQLPVSCLTADVVTGERMKKKTFAFADLKMVASTGQVCVFQLK